MPSKTSRLIDMMQKSLALKMTAPSYLSSVRTGHSAAWELDCLKSTISYSGSYKARDEHRSYEFNKCGNFTVLFITSLWPWKYVKITEICITVWSPTERCQSSHFNSTWKTYQHNDFCKGMERYLFLLKYTPKSQAAICAWCGPYM